MTFHNVPSLLLIENPPTTADRCHHYPERTYPRNSTQRKHGVWRGFASLEEHGRGVIFVGFWLCRCAISSGKSSQQTLVDCMKEASMKHAALFWFTVALMGCVL